MSVLANIKGFIMLIMVSLCGSKVINCSVNGVAVIMTIYAGRYNIRRWCGWRTNWSGTIVTVDGNNSSRELYRMRLHQSLYFLMVFHCIMAWYCWQSTVAHSAPYITMHPRLHEFLLPLPCHPSSPSDLAISTMTLNTSPESFDCVYVGLLLMDAYFIDVDLIVSTCLWERDLHILAALSARCVNWNMMEWSG